jgi:IclR family acetate operon transcriptional repressor
VMLAARSDLDGYLASAPFSPFTPLTLTDATALREDAAVTRARGYAHSDEDATIGIGALGVPVLDRFGALVGCVSLAGTAAEIRDRKDEFVVVLRDTARRLGSQRGACQREED